MKAIYQITQKTLNQTSNGYEHEADYNVTTEKSNIELKPPPLYKVIILNDDYTPMDFVVDVLEKFFNMDNETATRITLQVHTEGQGICGIYSKDIAETKTSLVNDYAHQNGYPLLCKIECQD